MRVLLVEDDQGVAAALVELLEQTGLTVTHTTRGDDVRNTIVNGRVLMRDRRVLTLDEAAVLSEARAYAEKVRAAVR